MIVDKNKSTHTQTDVNYTKSQRGGPIDLPPPIRKKSKNKKLLLALSFVLLSVSGISFYKNLNLGGNQSITFQALEQDLAREMILLGQEEADKEFRLKDTSGDLLLEREKKLTEKVNKLLEENEDTEAILSKCHIHNHDVHFIDRSGKILSHVQEGTPLSGKLEQAREVILANNSSGLAVVVKKKGLEIYNRAGLLQGKISTTEE